MELSNLKDLYIHELKDLYSAEKQLAKVLPKMAKAATNEKLVAKFKKHLEETKEHATRLEKILKARKATTRGPKCKGMEGAIAEALEMIDEDADPDVRDAGLIACAQRAEHYEIAGYGTARTYADALKDKAGSKSLQKTLDQEYSTNDELTKLAVETVNPAAKS
ncbi:MAG: ferritin-like domain-containing protein [Chthoniobacterales bacterium]